MKSDIIINTDILIYMAQLVTHFDGLLCSSNLDFTCEEKRELLTSIMTDISLLEPALRGNEYYVGNFKNDSHL
jgi:hypothetical protein